MDQNSNYNLGFLEDDYEEPQILLGIALEDCSEGSVDEIWEVVQSEDNPPLTESFQVLERIREQNVTNSVSAKSSSKKASYGHGLGLCKKALDIAITNGSNQILEDLLQQFISEQVLTQSKSTQELSGQELDQEIDNLNISDPFQHKGRGRPTNKRYLSSIENHDTKNVDLDERSRKKNKRQCAGCKSWYHDSRNCPLKK
ncbi:hypothetical protein C2G38_2044192 [Gigaspora rosea]|uniref:Uncharacterized protein n=1 Tax=Gigaspora rosea TaxID=44941 RepID=A0A397UK36_9GLOM|nr:hypothetical protein C2G38_2044192 [Gigaspora rosea]